jgi:hypothetical protein
VGHGRKHAAQLRKPKQIRWIVRDDVLVNFSAVCMAQLFPNRRCVLGALLATGTQ